MIDHARRLAAMGFHVFPLAPGRKDPPLIKDFPTKATRDATQIAAWWEWEPRANVGISTSRFGDDQALLVVDVDPRKGGLESLVVLELAGRALPSTWTQRTPSGGFHFIYVVPEPVRQGVDVLGPGLDVRSRGGYIVGAGSVLAD